MKFQLLLLFCFAVSVTSAQKQQFEIHNLSLPQELASPDNQFSGLYIANDKLFLLSESRIQEKAEGKLYAISLSDLDRKLTDTSYALPFRKYHIDHLEILVDKINAAGEHYEGLEAMVIDSNKVLLSVETDTPSPNCYLLTGQLNDTSVVLNTDIFMPVSKPITPQGAHIYNAGFEAVAKKDDHIFAFFEFNYFPSNNHVYQLSGRHRQTNSTPQILPVKKLPFRITDITYIGKNHFTAINYFFKGEGSDTIYRTPASDKRNSKLVKTKAGYRNYSRLVDIKLKSSGFRWKQLWEFPEQYSGYNWEGIAAYKNGYFIINDKYTSQRPYISTLLYLQKK